MNYVIVDLEATCWEQGRPVSDMEIIEIGAVIIDGTSFPPHFLAHMNLKHLFARAYSTKPTIGLREALRKRGMPFEGQHHRGIDDARNIARIAQTILILDR